MSLLDYESLKAMAKSIGRPVKNLQQAVVELQRVEIGSFGCQRLGDAQRLQARASWRQNGSLAIEVEKNVDRLALTGHHLDVTRVETRSLERLESGGARCVAHQARNQHDPGPERSQCAAGMEAPATKHHGLVANALPASRHERGVEPPDPVVINAPDDKDVMHLGAQRSSMSGASASPI